MPEQTILEICYLYEESSIRHYFEDGYVIPKIFVTGNERQMAAASTDLDYCLLDDARIALHALMAAASNAHTIGTIEQVWVDTEGLPLPELSWDEGREAAETDPTIRAGIATRAIKLETGEQLEMFTTFAFADDGDVAVIRRWRESIDLACGLPASAIAAQMLEPDQIDIDRIVRFAMKHGYVIYEGAA